MTQAMSPLPRLPRGVAAAVIFSLLPALAGCGAVGWLAHGVAGGEKTYEVDARYRELDGQRTAVMVAANEVIFYRHPNAPRQVRRMVSASLAEHVPDITLMDPDEVARYQEQHRYWITARPSDLIQALDIDRLIVIDLGEYQTHEPGNAHVWQGLISGELTVYEADAPDPDNPAFRTSLQTRFPEDSTVGVVDSDRQTIQLGMLTSFARQTARLFHDHEIRK